MHKGANPSKRIKKSPSQSLGSEITGVFPHPVKPLLHLGGGAGLGLDVEDIARDRQVVTNVLIGCRALVA
jgi:hypothetical protein